MPLRPPPYRPGRNANSWASEFFFVFILPTVVNTHGVDLSADRATRRSSGSEKRQLLNKFHHYRFVIRPDAQNSITSTFSSGRL